MTHWRPQWLKAQGQSSGSSAKMRSPPECLCMYHTPPTCITHPIPVTRSPSSSLSAVTVPLPLLLSLHSFPCLHQYPVHRKNTVLLLYFIFSASVCSDLLSVSQVVNGFCLHVSSPHPEAAASVSCHIHLSCGTASRGRTRHPTSWQFLIDLCAPPTSFRCCPLGHIFTTLVLVPK